MTSNSLLRLSSSNWILIYPRYSLIQLLQQRRQFSYILSYRENTSTLTCFWYKHFISLNAISKYTLGTEYVPDLVVETLEMKCLNIAKSNTGEMRLTNFSSLYYFSSLWIAVTFRITVIPLYLQGINSKNPWNHWSYWNLMFCFCFCFLCIHALIKFTASLFDISELPVSLLLHLGAIVK